PRSRCAHRAAGVRSYSGARARQAGPAALPADAARRRRGHPRRGRGFPRLYRVRSAHAGGGGRREAGGLVSRLCAAAAEHGDCMSSPARVAAKEPAGEAWRRLIGAASLTGAASLAGAALSIAATKVFAAMLGPSEIAVLSTLQQVRQAGVIGATLNGQTALVQGLSARGGEGDQAWRSFLRTSLLLIGAAGAAVSAILMTAPEWIARWSGIGPERTTLV